MNRTRLLLALFLLGSYGAGQNTPARVAEVEQLQVKREGSDVKIEVILTGTVQPSVETATNPDRLVLILPGTLSDAKQKRYPLNADGVQAVRVGLNSANPPVTRVVVDLDSAREYALSSEGNRVVLRVQSAQDARAARRDGPVPAASAPLVGVFRRKPQALPAEPVASAPAPVPVPPKFPPINFPEKQATTTAAAASSSTHPKFGSLQQGTVFPGAGTPGSGSVPQAQTASTTPGPSVAGVTQQGGAPASTFVTAAAPAKPNTTAPPLIVTVAPTSGPNAEASPVATTSPTSSTATISTTSSAGPGVMASNPTPAKVVASTPTANTPATPTSAAAAVSTPTAAPAVTASTTAPPAMAETPKGAPAAATTATPALPTTSSAGAPNVTTKVTSATVTPSSTPALAASTAPQATVANPLGSPAASSLTPATTTATNSAPSTPQRGTVANPLGLPSSTTAATPATAANPAPAVSQGATVANPLGLPPSSSATSNPTAASSAPANPGATVSNPLGLAPGETPQLAPVDGAEAAESNAAETTVAAVPSLEPSGVKIADQLGAPADTSAAKTENTTMAKATAPAMPPMPAELALRATHPDFRTTFRVKYVASGVAYLDGGRGAGLAEGMKLVVRETPTGSVVAAASGSDEHIVAELEVKSVAEASAVTDIHTPNRDVKPGDVAYLSAQDEQALVQQSTLSSTRKYPTVISFTEDDTLDEEARAQIPKPPLPSINRARGRFGFDYIGTAFHGSNGTAGGSNTNVGLVARLDMTRIGGTYWNASGYWRGQLTSNSYQGTQTLQDVINRTYHLAMTYDNPHSAWVAGFGRMYLPWATSLDTIDGGYFGRRMGHGSTLGVFAGSTPDPSSYSYNPDRRIGGLFVNFEGGSYDDFRFTSTSGIGVSTIKWQIDRPFIFFENGVSYKRYVSVYDSLQADSPAGNTVATAPGPGIGRNFLTVRFQPHERIEFDANYNYFRDVPTFDPTLISTTLLDKYLFQGFSAGMRLEVIKQLWLYTQLGRSSRSGDPTASLNELYGITLGRVPWVKIRADAHYSRFNSSFGSGYYESVSLSRSLSDSFRLEVLGGKQNFSSAYSSNSNTHYVTSNLEMNMGMHYFLQGGYTFSRGVIQNYDQWLITMGYRFDTRQKGGQ